MSIHDIDAAFARANERPRFLAGGEPNPADPSRLAANFAAIEAELDAPAPSRLERLLLRLGVGEGNVPLITATPALRRSWIVAVLIAVLFSLTAANNSTAEGVDQIVAFLTMAPLIPLAGVALAFGPRVDPTHDVALAAPIDGFRLFLIRALTVVGASTLALLIASLVIPAGGSHRVAWLLPALAATSVTMALATRFDARMAAAAVAATWIVIVTIAVGATDASAAFGPTMQVLSMFVAAAGAIGLWQRRRRLDVMSDR
ncbi:MAG: zf-HC2 domain-containing protein [Actinomycetota bacterium]